MSGIAGWIDWEEDLSRQGPLLKHMADTLIHRGPDEQGQWLSSRAALAHCRLKILDPEGGRQPMTFQAGDDLYVITYNGEIYNFQELRHELEGHGHVFHTVSDTEVLLHAFVEWGTSCLNRLNGIFAFALWDESRQQLLLARDHMGVKPLYYARRGSAILFASELKALLAHPLVKAEVDTQGLTELFSFRPAPGSSVYRHVHELRAAHQAVCNRHGIHITRYWSLQSLPHTDDLPTTAEHIEELLEDAVRRQLVGEVPVVSMLSGGLDSSCLTVLAAREFKRAHKQLHTYSIDYVHSAEHFSESAIRPSLDAPWVQRIAEYAGTIHHTVTIDTPELLEALLVPLRAFDLPVIGQMATSLYLLFKTIREQATVALSGEAADEIFGGYPWFQSETVLNAQTFPWFVPAQANASQRNSNTMIWLAPELQEKAGQSEHIAQQYQEALAEVPRLDGEDAYNARMREIFYLNLIYFLPMLLDRKDRMSMALGLEVRVPFCDYRLVQYAWNIPWEMKMAGNREKGILRQAFADILPDDARKRRKSAYPASHNPAYLLAIQELASQILNDSNAPVQALINKTIIRAVAENKVPGLSGEQSAFLLGRVIQMNEWMREYHITLVT